MEAKKSGIERPEIRTGLHPGYCWCVAGIGRIKPDWDMNFAQIVFELPEYKFTYEDGNPGVETVAQRFAIDMGNISRPSPLAMFLQQWRNKAFESDDYNTFNLKNILGAAAMLDVEARKSTAGKTYYNIRGIRPACRRGDGTLFIRGQVPSEEFDFPAKINDPVYFNPLDPDYEALKRVPRWIVRDMERNGAIPVTHQPQQPAPAQQQQQGFTPAPGDDDDEVPF